MAATPIRVDAVVVGGGLVGCLAARALAAAGARVVLCERRRVLGSEASTAAAGMLAPQMEGAEGLLTSGGAARREAMWELCLAAREGYGAFVAGLEAETGRQIARGRQGALVAALDAHGARELEAAARRQAERGLRAEWLDGAAARRLEPLLAPGLTGALHLPDDTHVDNVALTAAAAAAVVASPLVEIRGEAPVRAITTKAGRTAGVEVDARAIQAPLVVLAAGAWSGTIGGLPRPLPVRPVKGQMAALRPAELPARIVAGPGGYCVPREDGRLLVGATIEETGFDASITSGAVHALMAAASALLPALAGERVVERWAGLRPGTPDGLPILGEDPALPGLVHASGHYRNGILLAPITAEIVAAIAGGSAPPVDPRPFSADRDFGG